MSDECPVCLDRFQKPFVTPNCGHTFCFDCMQGLVTTSPSRTTSVRDRSVRCPECRDEFVLSAAKHNVALSRMVNSQPQSNPIITATPSANPTEHLPPPGIQFEVLRKPETVGTISTRTEHRAIPGSIPGVFFSTCTLPCNSACRPLPPSLPFALPPSRTHSLALLLWTTV
jgi:hypothetical protein